MKSVDKIGRLLQSITLIPGIAKAGDGTPFSPVTSTKTIYTPENICLDTIVKDVENKIENIVNGGQEGQLSIKELGELLIQLNEDKVNRSGDTITGSLTVNQDIIEAGTKLSEKYSGIGHNHNTEYYTKTEINNKFGSNSKTGSGNMAGSSRGILIPHGLGRVPSFAAAFPTAATSGNLGEVWITMDATNITVYNSGSYTSTFTWFAT